MRLPLSGLVRRHCVNAIQANKDAGGSLIPHFDSIIANHLGHNPRNRLSLDEER
jgi:hypothetical protein